ncbi:MAG: hypothetical protein AABX28_03465 [Nanoarchaeota archaeon]
MIPELEERDLVLCTVERIEKTIVFVKVHLQNRDADGSIVTSEIAPGRIRNLRDYVVPKKKIVCKVLRISQTGNIELSLRRVTPKERKEVMEQNQQERSYTSILKNILGEKADEKIEEIKKEGGVYWFVKESLEEPKKLEKILGKENAKKILELVGSEKQKKAVIKKEINFKTYHPEGIELIKKILGSIKGAELKYISAGRYSIKAESDNLKKTDAELKEIFSGIERDAKKQKMEFSIKEK